MLQFESVAFVAFFFQCRLRDFPQAIFTSQSVEVKGTFLGAEQKPANRSMYLCAKIYESRLDVSF